MNFRGVLPIVVNLYKIYKKFVGILIIFCCLWIAQSINDSQKKKEQETEKQAKEKLKNERFINVRIIEQL